MLVELKIGQQMLRAKKWIVAKSFMQFLRELLTKFKLKVRALK